MKIIHRFVLFLALTSLLGFSWPFSATLIAPKEPTGSHVWIQKQTKILKSHAPNINENVLRLSLIAYLNARKKGIDHNQLLAVIDYTKPSYEKRLWVFNLRNGTVLFNTFVAHGKNSGMTLPTSFSNTHGSLQSSIGVFLTEQPYMGGNGYSLRLKGLEEGINNNSITRRT